MASVKGAFDNRLSLCLPAVFERCRDPAHARRIANASAGNGYATFSKNTPVLEFRCGIVFLYDI